jgi:hypothetical protein
VKIKIVGAHRSGILVAATAGASLIARTSRTIRTFRAAAT